MRGGEVEMVRVGGGGGDSRDEGFVRQPLTGTGEEVRDTQLPRL